MSSGDRCGPRRAQQHSVTENHFWMFRATRHTIVIIVWLRETNTCNQESIRTVEISQGKRQEPWLESRASTKYIFQYPILNLTGKFSVTLSEEKESRVKANISRAQAYRTQLRVLCRSPFALVSARVSWRL